ncbi:uncharacterized protein BDW43DRAFT_289566 [Aspergillus alliaceus]|uniref:uncharacterized protein n=1 Tax=Petromyces alliaceus TaxID=209559 RepID=UPI0012A5DA1B|nr:uncharacterized protein BDW43DRAFT_289566 [Aspergillus alliaceus]KAB8229009.1 hypothetical protein BDW43DRAFT_289566 [Aspergillus alliaceus]
MYRRESARRLVEEIAKDHGYLDETVLGTMPAEVRRKVEEAMLKKDEMIGSSVITYATISLTVCFSNLTLHRLSKNLYNSSARFVFELLQNADDNLYHKAQSLGSMPYVSFRVYPKRIVLECNEDGFTPENLTAICSVGKSSKQGAQGYIGEKGIGFKSVFMVAWKVHIQSGDFSFSFNHRPGDSGMGMISPVWEEPEQIPEPHLTRITLYLHEPSTDESFSRQYETTLEQFRELQATFLLFMKNLRRIEVKIHSDRGEETSSTIFTREPGHGDRQTTLRQRTVEGSNVQETSQDYYIATEKACHLPKSENRTYTQSEIESNAYATSDVVVALPLCPDFTPIIEVQDVYAFLPIRKMGFYFLIQADFVTDASRQDIVRSSARNAALIPFIASAFVQALSKLSIAQHSSIRYTWMRFLPEIAKMSQDRFWGKLVNNIFFFLLGEAMLWTRTHSRTRGISFMLRTGSRYLDRSWECLLPDLQDEQYLAPEYKARDLDLLKGYGLCWMEFSDFLVRLEQDLDQGSGSRMHAPDTSDDWHTRVADILIEACPKWSTRIRRLKIIPLVGGAWTSISASNSSIYFSFIARYKIPSTTGVCLVEPSAELNPRRKALFRLMGVKEAEVPDVRRWVLNSLNKNIPDLGTSRKHLAFLYQTAHLDPDTDRYAYYKNSSVCDHRGYWRSIQASRLYFPSHDEYGAQQLLQPESDYSGHSYILHPEYINKNTPETPEGESRTWQKWLQQVLNIRDEIPLVEDGSLSIECAHVGKALPAKFLGFLLRYWLSGGDKVLADPALVKKLLTVKVPCEDGREHPIGETYVCTEHLEYAKQFLHDGEFFPWLDSSVVAENQTRLSDISIVSKALGFGYPKSDIEFIFVVLRYIKEANPGPSPLQDIGRVIDLYDRLYTRWRESATPDITRKMIRDAFDKYRLVYIPRPANNPKHYVRWDAPKCCIWESPEHIWNVHPLQKLYGDIPDTDFVARLFKDILWIRNVDAMDVLEELVLYSQENIMEEDGEICSLYHTLTRLLPQKTSEDVEYIRESFYKYSLIYHQNEDGSSGWYKPSQCLWSKATNIDGMVALNDEYEGLEEFFVDIIGVQTLTLEMVITKLVDQGSTSASIEEVKETIWLLNKHLQTDEEVPDSQSIRDAKVFPVRDLNGQILLRSCDEAFSIADRKHLYDYFAGKAHFLDFSVNDIHRLAPFLNWAGLERRYLSVSVKEISRLSNGAHQSLVSKDRNIALRAYGLLRIAAHYNSPRMLKSEDTFYELLRKIKVCATDGISSELHLNQDGKDILVEVSRSELHLHEADTDLTIYVPRDEKAQCLCFVDRIPKALLEWIMTEPTTRICAPFPDRALDVMEKVLQVPLPYVAATLDRAGVVSIETEEVAEEDDTDLTTSNDDRQAEEVSGDAASGYSNQFGTESNTPSTTFPTPSVVSGEIGGETMPSPRTRPNFWSFPPSSLLTTPRPAYNAAPVDIEYRSILDKVVSAARQFIFPTRDSIDTSLLGEFQNLHLREQGDNTGHLRSLEKLERDKRIGAAGELFVFEVLSRLSPNLPGFSRENWQSTIRQYIQLHEDYIDLQPWCGRETADLVYTDSEGIMTSFLIAKGYLSSELWAGKRPRFYLEVKSTTSSCETPFYMSKYQYERMQSSSEDASGTGGSERIYIIFRVFNIGTNSVAMKVFVDPESMRRSRHLLFTAETWSIVPGSGEAHLNNGDQP